MSNFEPSFYNWNQRYFCTVPELTILYSGWERITVVYTQVSFGHLKMCWAQKSDSRKSLSLQVEKPKNSVCTYFMIQALFQMNKNPNCHNNWINKTLSTPIFVIASLNKLVLEELRKSRVDWMKKYCKNIKLN